MSPEELAARLDDLLREVRRQGKAAIGAQASADACLDAISHLVDGDAEEDATPTFDAVSFVRALLPAVDAVDRIASAAESDERSLARTWLSRLTQRERGGGRLAAPLRLLQSQLEGALESHGIVIDRRAGVPVQGAIHRVVETRRVPSPATGSVVLAVVRPGYAFRGRCLREADVVASLPPPVDG